MVTSAPRVVRIASRGSRLALWQAEHVRGRLIAAEPALRVEIHTLRTIGDRVTEVPLSAIGDRGLFTREIDDALLRGEADLAVHSLKDVPTQLHPELVLAAVTERQDPRDVLICRAGVPAGLGILPHSARVGTSSLRRRAQLLALRPDLQVLDVRGNLDTRLRKLDDGDYDALILAAAGVLRLGLDDRISEYLDPESWLPAPGQGALAVVAHRGDADLRWLAYALNHPASAEATQAERTFLRRLEGGCQVPIGALARRSGSELRLNGLVAAPDGSSMIRVSASGAAGEPDEVGIDASEQALARNAGPLLARVRGLGQWLEPAAP